MISTTPLGPDLARLCSVNMRAHWCLSLEISSGGAVLGAYGSGHATPEPFLCVPVGLLWLLEEGQGAYGSGQATPEPFLCVPAGLLWLPEEGQAHFGSVGSWHASCLPCWLRPCLRAGCSLGSEQTNAPSPRPRNQRGPLLPSPSSLPCGPHRGCCLPSCSALGPAELGELARRGC